MTAQERLFAFEMEFHRRLRQCAAVDGGELHVSWAMSMGYDGLLADVRGVSADDVCRIAQRMIGLADSRDVLAARDSLMRLMGIVQYH